MMCNQMEIAQGHVLVRVWALMQATIGCCILLVLVLKMVLPLSDLCWLYFQSSTSANTSLALMVGITCNWHWWCFFLCQLPHLMMCTNTCALFKRCMNTLLLSLKEGCSSNFGRSDHGPTGFQEVDSCFSFNTQHSQLMNHITYQGHGSNVTKLLADTVQRQVYHDPLTCKWCPLFICRFLHNCKES